MFHGEWRRGQRQIDALRQQLSVERGRMDTPGLTPVEDSVELLADERRARRVLELLPDSGGLVQSLRLDATFGTLAVDELDPLHTFCEEFKKTSFDNPRSHTAFMNLYRAAEALSIWVNEEDRKSTRLNSSHVAISYAVSCLKKKRITFERKFSFHPKLADKGTINQNIKEL